MITKRNLAGEQVSLLGFGCMRFPTGKDGKIDRSAATKMIDEAMQAGINYYDTAYMYHGGESESFVGEALVSRYPRDSFYLATKLPVIMIESAEQAKEIFAEQLARLGTDHFDFYLLHSLNRNTFRERVLGYDLLGLCEEWQREGKIRHLGFSFHDDFDAFEEILTYRKWDFCQIQYNYMDTENQAGDRGVALAESLGVPLVVMEPIRGGNLVRYPEEIRKAFSALDPTRNLANWALSWVGSHTQVKVILSGMSTCTQLRDNLRTFSNFRSLSGREMNGIGEIVTRIRARVRNGCTGCRYCMPCPAGVNIPRAFALMNEEAMHGHTAVYKKRYLSTDASALASACVSCGACLVKCPQHIPVPQDLIKVKQLFGK